MHKQYNIISTDQRQITLPGNNNKDFTIADIGPDYHDYKQEDFDIEYMEVSISSGHPITFSDKEYSEIVESSNYYTFISKDRIQVSVIRYEDVTSYKFKLKEQLK